MSTRFAGALLGLSLLSACQIQTGPATPASSVPLPGASQTSAATATPQPGATPVPTSPIPSSPMPEASPQPVATLPPGIVPPTTIRFAANLDRFLDGGSESTQLKAEFLDALGQPLSFAYPLEWTSSRPEIVSISAAGLAQAQNRDGYATITVKIPGTTLSASLNINVNLSFGGGGGGGGGSAPGSANTPPRIVSMLASNTTVTGGGFVVRLNAEASDGESSLRESDYSWSCTPALTCGSFNVTTGRQLYWTSPAVTGPQLITLTVSDGQLSSQQTLTINVLDGTGSVSVNP